MTKIMKTMTNTIPTCLLALMVLALSMATQAEQHEEKEATGRAVVATMEAVVTDINLETRQVTLKGPQGNNVTLTAREKVIKGGVSEEGAAPAIGAARVIRAVCTIEGMNRALGAVTIKDPNGKLHVIGGVEPEKMEGVTLGQTVVIVYAEALALTLKQKAGTAQ